MNAERARDDPVAGVNSRAKVPAIVALARRQA